MPPSLPRNLILSRDAGSGVAERLRGFVLGTQILTPRGEVAIETLRPGDPVLVAGGGTLGVTGRTDRRLDPASLARSQAGGAVVVRADALGRGQPGADLRLAPAQEIRLDGCTATAAQLVNGVTIAPDRASGAVTFVRLSLNNAASLMVGGLACPVHAAPADLRSAVALRGRADGIAGPPAGRRLDGRIEEASATHTVGWTLDPSQPGAAVPLEIAIDGIPIAWTFADRRRPDLEQRGLGGGACAFAVRFTAPPAGNRTRFMTVRRASDGTDVPGSPILLRPPAAPEVGLASLLAAAAGQARTDGARTALAATLLAHVDAITWDAITWSRDAATRDEPAPEGTR